MRVLITGSRDWDDFDTFIQVIDKVWEAFDGPDNPARPLILVHGNAVGADRMAEDYKDMYITDLVTTERYPADWSTGRGAGFDRNALMVSKGADLCVAFVNPCDSPKCPRRGEHDSHGTTHCVSLARQANIPVITMRS